MKDYGSIDLDEDYSSPLNGDENQNQDNIAAIANHVKEILALLGEDTGREGLMKTPDRVAKALKFLTSGSRLEKEVESILTTALFSQEYNEMVLIKDIEFYSLCEHHLLPFYGKVHIAYLPDSKVIGLSKIPRIVDVYAKRLQLQERMAIQIRDAIQNHLHPRGVAVVIEACHMCMIVRGVQKQKSTTITSALSGNFLTDPKTRAEFMQLIRD